MTHSFKFPFPCNPACGLVLALALGGCATIPADKDLLPQQDLARAELAASIKLARSGWPEAQWWTRYQDPQLNALIAQALKDGPSLQVAAARVATARATLQLNSSEQGVNVNLNAGSNRQRYSSNGLFPAPIGGSYYTETTLQVVANYDFDWWGRHKALISSALGEVNASQAEYAQAEQTLSAAVAQSYFSMQGDWSRLDNIRHMQALQSNLVADKARRIAHGVAGADSERMAELDLAGLKQQATQLETHMAREREALRALLGADANALTDLTPIKLPEVPSTLPEKLGIELLARRPDLQAARWRVEASLDRIEANKAAFYPDVSLTGFFGTDAVSIDQLFNYPSRTMFIGPSLSLPLFDSGRLKARLGGARSQRNEMIADYNQSVINAVRDVAHEGIGLQGLKKQRDEQATTTALTQAVLHSTQARFKQGLTDRSHLLDAELTVDKQQDAELQLKSQQLITQVALIKALGGGYQVAPDPSVTQNTVHLDK